MDDRSEAYGRNQSGRDATRASSTAYSLRRDNDDEQSHRVLSEYYLRWEYTLMNDVVPRCVE